MTTNVKEETRIQKFKRLYPELDPRYAMFDWADPEELDKVPLDEELTTLKQKMIDEYVTPYKLTLLPGYVLDSLVKINALPSNKRIDAIDAAWKQLKMNHLALRAKGIIKLEGESKPMPEDVKEHLRELNAQRREQKKLLAPKKEKKIKLSIYNDRPRQAMMIEKYPWIIPESFRPDPDATFGTILEIKCQNCGEPRTIHAADTFQCRYCKRCKDNK